MTFYTIGMRILSMRITILLSHFGSIPTKMDFSIRSLGLVGISL